MIAPCSNIGTRGYPAVFGSITRTSFCFRFLPCAEVLRCTRTPTAVKGNALSRFRTTACRLRSYRTQSASGRFSTSDSPPSIPLNLYSKGAAPREGLLLSSGSGYSIAACFLFVNDLINKNCIKCSAKTPNFHCLVPTPLRAGRWQILRAARKRKTAVRIRRRTAAAALVQRSLGAALWPPKIQSSRSWPICFHLPVDSHTAIVCAAARKNARTGAAELERT